jgi:hypothetical protein
MSYFVAESTISLLAKNAIRLLCVSLLRLPASLANVCLIAQTTVHAICKRSTNHTLCLLCWLECDARCVGQIVPHRNLALYSLWGVMVVTAFFPVCAFVYTLYRLGTWVWADRAFIYHPREPWTCAFEVLRITKTSTAFT